MIYPVKLAILPAVQNALNFRYLLVSLKTVKILTIPNLSRYIVLQKQSLKGENGKNILVMQNVGKKIFYVYGASCCLKQRTRKHLLVPCLSDIPSSNPISKCTGACGKNIEVFFNSTFLVVVQPVKNTPNFQLKCTRGQCTQFVLLPKLSFSLNSCFLPL